MRMSKTHLRGLLLAKLKRLLEAGDIKEALKVVEQLNKIN